ncbi:REDY-like protein HapK [Sphingosinithalassobacter portus]|uniref:REDY-like protein HapK n=1 Tax=Stakelama portus TaxID=2676234 RepID=UPI000D6E22D9|nr:REDY-like protein HapK [Sphingosinithalassobacter portus]
MKIIVLFNLKPGVSAQEYEAWAREFDIPGANGLDSVESFTVHRATGLFGSDAPSPYDYIELLDITEMDPFVAEVSAEAFQAIAARFADFADNPQFILTEAL